MIGSISFDGNDLQTANILTQDIDHNGGPSKSMTSYPLAHANASIIPFISYPYKTVNITGEIIGSSITDLDNRLDVFKAYFNNQNTNLDIGWNGGTRRYIATADEPQISRPGGLFYANFSIAFTCTQPFGQDISATTALTATSRTASSYSDAFTFTGSAPWQLPIATITLTSQTATGAQNIVFGSAVTGQAITVRRTWVNGDVLVVNSRAKIVTVNGIAVDYSGAFPMFAPGSQAMIYSDTFTTRTFNVTVVYTAMWK